MIGIKSLPHLMDCQPLPLWNFKNIFPEFNTCCCHFDIKNVMYLSDIKSCIHRGAILIRWGAILIRWGAILIRRGARCSSMLWTLCEVSSFPRVCLCWQLLASVLLASVLLPINLILLCIYLTLNLVSIGAQFLSVGAQFLSVGAQFLSVGAQDAPACYGLCVK